MAHRRLGADMDSEKHDAATANRPHFTRRRRWRIHGLFGAVARQPDRAGRGHRSPAHAGAEPFLSLRLPRGRVRFLCDDRQWQAALDLSHAREPGRGRRRDRHRAAAQHAAHQDLVVDMREFFQKWKRAGNTFVGTATRHDPPAMVSPQSKAQAGRRRHRMHQLRRVLRGLRRGVLGPGVSRPGGAEPRLDAVQRRAPRRSQGRAATGDLGQRLQFLPHAGQLHEALSG